MKPAIADSILEMAGLQGQQPMENHSLSEEEFIRCFLIHVLPDWFMKIRHYVLVGNRNKTVKLNLCKRITHAACPVAQAYNQRFVVEADWQRNLPLHSLRRRENAKILKY